MNHLIIAFSAAIIVDVCITAGIVFLTGEAHEPIIWIIVYVGILAARFAIMLRSIIVEVLLGVVYRGHLTDRLTKDLRLNEYPRDFEGLTDAYNFFTEISESPDAPEKAKRHALMSIGQLNALPFVAKLFTMSRIERAIAKYLA